MRPNRTGVVRLRLTNNDGEVNYVELRPGDSVDVHHTLNFVNHEHVSGSIRGRACVIELA